MLSVTEDIYGNARIYILIIFLGLPFTLLYNFLSSILRAVGDSRTPFLFLAFSACLNVVLDLTCIIVFKWGCAGAAFSTITAQAISGLCCLIFYYKESADTSSEEKRLSFTAGLCERNAGDGPADGTAVFHHGHRQYGDAVGQ